MTDKNDFPHNYPAHLSDDYDVGYFNGSLPAGCHQLPFEKLHDEQFEQLCWWLIRKDHQLVDPQRLGGAGKDQYGIDLYAFDYLDPTKFLVFECKCWEDYKADKLRDAVTKFLKGDWANRASKFTLILAQKDIGKLSKEWAIQRERLHEAGINTELWTGLHLTERIQRFPDILSKFFPGPCVTFFGNEWMQRVGFYERLLQALVDPRPGVAKTAKTYLETSDDKASLTVERKSESEWGVKRPWLDLSCILPHGRFYPGSAMVIFKRGDLMGASITFDQKWLLKNLIGTPGAPLTHEFRPFLNGVSPDSTNKDERFIIDLKNFRCILSTEETEDLAYVADRLSAVFLDSLAKRESAWGASGFPFVHAGDIRVVICTMPKRLWMDMLEFSRHHNYEKGDTEWHIFDLASNRLAPYTKTSSSKYKRGFHGMFYISVDLNGLTYGDNVALLWSPPDLLYENTISPQQWWSCEYAFGWLKEQLIPEMGNWLVKRSFNDAKYIFSRQKRKLELLSWWQKYAQINDVRVESLLENQQFKLIGLRNVVAILQEYFSPLNKDYISTDEIVALYRALIILLRSGRGHIEYIVGNLSIQNTPRTHTEVAAILEHRILSDRQKLNPFSVDYSLRAMMEIIGDEDSWMNDDDQSAIFEALKPFMRHYDQGMLIKRHSRWI